MKQNLKSEFDHELRHQTMTQTKMINAPRQEIDHLGAALATAGSPTPIVAPGSPTPGCDSTPPPPLHHYNQMMLPPAGSLVKVMDVLNRSMTNQYAVLQETLRQLQSTLQGALPE